MKTIIAIAGAMLLAVGARAQVVEYPGLTVGLVTNIANGLQSGSPTALGNGVLASAGQRSKAFQTAQLIDKLKAGNLWTNCLYLQVFGKGYQNTSNNLIIRGPRTDMWGTNWNFALHKEDLVEEQFTLSATCSNVTLLVAGTGANIADSGTERNLIYIHNPAYTSFLRVYKASGGALTAHTVGGGSQQFYDATASPHLPYPVMSYITTLASADKAVVVYTNGISAVSNVFTHTAPTGMNTVDFGKMPFNYAIAGIWSTALSSNDVTVLENILRATVLGANCNILTDGDSILNITADGVTAWTAYIFGQGSDWITSGSYFNACTSGHETLDVLSGLPAQILQAKTNTAERTIGIIDVGTNDIGNHDSTNLPLATIQTRLSAIWNSYRTNGVQPVIACTLLSRGFTNRPATDLADLNTFIRSKEGSDYDVLCDLDRQFLTLLGPNYHTNTSYFDVEGIHPNATGGAGLRVMRDAFQAISPKVFP